MLKNGTMKAGKFVERKGRFVVLENKSIDVAHIKSFKIAKGEA